MIPQGTKVLLKTTNGGELVTRLLETYRPTYSAVIESGNGYAIITAHRIKSISRC